MKKIIFIGLSFIALFNACKKSELGNVTNTGSIDSLSYQPSVAGSKWTYDVALSGIKISTYDVICQNYDSVINGITYDVYINTSDNSKIFNRRNGDKYYNVLTSSTNKTELCVLDASKNINDTLIGGVNGSDTYTYTIVEKTPTMVLNGISLKNVLKVYTERKDNNTGAVTLSGYSWYAQGVGTIKNTGTISGQPTEITLTSATIQ